MKLKKINVLGTIYTVEQLSKSEDDFLNKCDGYCDNTIKKIVIIKKENDCQIQDFERYKRKILRHEITHAFLFESGLGENMKHAEFGHDEEMVDWFAYQYPKLKKVFKEMECDE